MEEDFKCPVCGKVGIPNFHVSDIKCPCCGSDLSIYRVIDQIEGKRSNHNYIWKAISVIAILIAASLGWTRYSSQPHISSETLNDLNELKDSICSLNKQLENQPITPPIVLNGFPYCVQKGDSYWSISRKFYGTGTYYEELAAENNRTIDDRLNVGDTLVIK